MAIFEVNDLGYDMGNPAEVIGTVTNPSETYFELLNGPDLIEVTGFGFIYADGEPIAGTVTSIDWMPGTHDFTISDLSWDITFDAAAGYTADGQQLTGSLAELAFWLTGNDTVLGSAQADTLLGFEGNDVIEGNDGDDELQGWSGNDTLRGGNGNDTLLGGAGSDLLHGGAGDDVIDGGAILDRVNYTDLNNVSYLDATEGVVVDLSGITGDGSTGEGYASGGAGNDVLRNVNFVRGGQGSDSITGSSASIFEHFEGGEGDDTIDGGAITNTTNSNRASYAAAGAAVTVDLQAGTASGALTGNDTLVNINHVRGSNHADTLYGSGRTDYTELFEGGAGNDLIDGRAGTDFARYDSASAAVNVNLAAGTATGAGTGTDTLVGIEGVFGSNFADTLTGGAGNDFLRGHGGNDTLDGGAGVDFAFYTSSTTGINVNLGAGTAVDGIFVGGVQGNDTLLNIENVRGSAFNDNIVGSAANNRLEGEAGNDVLNGGAGNDVLIGGAGSDVLIGGTGNDTMDGGVITDRFNYTDLNILNYSSDTLGVNVNLSGITGDGSTGQGSVTARSTVAGNAGTDVVMNVNYVIGGSGADSIVGSGAAIFEMFDGGAGNDTINGGTISSAANANRVTYQNTGAAVNVNLGTGIATGTSIGTDTLININQVRGSGSNDTITGSDRTDFTESFEGRGGNDLIDGRGGYDIARYDLSNTGAIQVDLASGIANTNEGQDTLVGIEAVYGTTFDDTLLGGNVATGGDSYNDTSKSESFRGGAGNDFIDGGAGFDRAEYTNAATGVHVALDAGLASDGLGGTDTLVGIEGVRGSDHNDTLIGSDRDTYGADRYVEYFEGNAGNDLIQGGGGIDAVHYTTSGAGVNVNLQAGTASDGFGGTDTLEGIEFVRGSAFNDTIVGANGFTVLEGGAGNDVITAGDGNDRAYGQDGNDSVLGMAGNDSLEGGNGNDTLEGGTGNDTLLGGAGDDLLLGGDGNDVLIGEAGNDSMVGGAGSDHFTTVFHAGNDTMDGGVITDRINYTDLNSITYQDQTAGVTINLSGITGDGSTGQGTATSAAIGTDVLRNINFITGSQGNDSIVGSSALIFEQFDGGAGNDTIDGGAITDLVNTDNSNRVTYQFVGAGVNVNLATGSATGGGGTDVLRNISAVRGSNHNDTLTGSDTTAYTEQFEGRNGNDYIDGRGGFDIARYEFDGFAVNVDLVAGRAETLDSLGGVLWTDTLVGVEGVIGSAKDDTLTGGNTANGTTYTDGKLEVFRGSAGNDFIDGGAGVDRADYIVVSSAVNVDLATGLASDGTGGTDTLVGIEGVRGSELDDTLSGSDRDNSDGYFEFFEGRAGNDVIDGRGGVDWAYYNTAREGVNVDLQAGTASQDGYDGTDTLANIEGVRGSVFNDTLTGANGGTTLEGLAGNDLLNGGDGDDLLVGGAGNDTMAGSTGDDTYNVDALTDSVVEAAGEGTDRVLLNLSAAASYTAAANVEEVIVNAANPASTLAIHVTGNAGDNLLVGNAGANSLVGGEGNDTLDGGLGNDTLVGGGGDDLYKVNVATDVISETVAGAAGGYDVVEMYYSGSYTLGANIEEAALMVAGNGNLTGNALNNWLDGNNFANSLSGAAGSDTLVGNGGNDTIDGGADSDTAIVGGNADLYVVSRPDAISTVLTGNGMVIVLRNVEFVEFDDGIKSLADLHLNIATAFNDSISGDAGDNTLDGLGGSDTIFGDAGNDSLVGGTGADRLDGGIGDDTLVGGTENDIYVVDSLGDVLVETATGGIDTVMTDLGVFSLAPHANVENVAYTGAGNFAGTGNAGANIVAGWTGDDTLDGGLGNDTLQGYAGDDTYVVNVATDVVVEAANAGQDTVHVAYTVAGTYTLGANVENATVTGAVATNVTGNVLDNRLEGNAASNVLAGGDGADTLVVSGGTDTLDGGAGGSDTAIFSGNRADWSPVSRPNATDLRISNGTSIVTLRGIETFVFDDGPLSLSEFMENALSIYNDSWTGGAGDDESGDALAGNDVLDGKEGNDTLNGGLGSDTLIGGTGDDTFVVNVASDVVVEAADEGIDEVRVAYAAAGAYTLAANVENATVVTSLAGVNVNGNALDNRLVGGAGANSLSGGAGHDTLDGGLGDDTLVGGAGDDLYVVNSALDVVSEGVGAGTDRVEIRYTAAGSYTMTANVEEAVVIAAANIAVNVTGNDRDNDITGHAGNNVLVGGVGNDILEGGGGNDTLNGGAGIDEAILAGSVDDYTITRVSTTQTNFVHNGTGAVVQLVGIENLVFYAENTADESDDTTAVLQDLLDTRGSPGNDTLRGGATAELLDAGAGNDLVFGNDGDDTLRGAAGADTLRGGAGDDVLEGGLGGDTYQFGVGSGNDTIVENDATALVVDTVVIDAGSGNPAGGEVRLTRDAADVDDLLITITSGDNAEVTETLRIDEYFRNDAVSSTGGIETIRFTDGNVTLSTAQILSELLKGTGSDDTIRGYSSNDSINGLEGNDVIAGAAGNDTLIGNWGDDSLSGDAGADLLQGNLGADTLAGGDGNDILDGGAGGDDLDGGLGNDVLLGGAGEDQLQGGDGLDTLTGGAGDDTLTGGAGQDRFVLNSLDGIDSITDFSSVDDVIAINKSVFTGIEAAVGTTVDAAGLGDDFVYDQATGTLTYDADGDGAGAATIVAQFEPGTALAADFLIIG